MSLNSRVSDRLLSSRDVLEISANPTVILIAYFNYLILVKYSVIYIYVIIEIGIDEL